MRKRVPSKRLSGCFLVPANPRQPKYSLGQTQFYANQCFSVSTAFLVQKRVQKEVKCQTFGSFFRHFFSMLFKGVLWCRFLSLLATFGVHLGPLGSPKGGKRGGELEVLLQEGCLGTLWEPILDHFGSIWGGFWDAFLQMFGVLWGSIWAQETQRNAKGTPKKKQRNN